MDQLRRLVTRQADQPVAPRLPRQPFNVKRAAPVRSSGIAKVVGTVSAKALAQKRRRMKADDLYDDPTARVVKTQRPDTALVREPLGYRLYKFYVYVCVVVLGVL